MNGLGRPLLVSLPTVERSSLSQLMLSAPNQSRLGALNI